MTSLPNPLAGPLERLITQSVIEHPEVAHSLGSAFIEDRRPTNAAYDDRALLMKASSPGNDPPAQRDRSFELRRGSSEDDA